MSDNDNGGLMNVLNKISTEEANKQAQNSDEILNDSNSESTSDSASASAKTDNKAATENTKHKLGLGPKIVMATLIIFVGYSFIMGPNQNKQVATTKEVEKSLAGTEKQNLDKVKLDDIAQAMTPEIGEKNTNTTMLDDVTEKDSNFNSDVTNQNTQSSEVFKENETKNSDLFVSLDDLTMTADEVPVTASLINGLSDLEELPSSSFETFDEPVALGSVVTEDDINKLRDIINKQNTELKQLKDLYMEEIASLKPKIAILTSEIEKKKYDLSWEKDRPVITKLIISRPLTNCDSCVAHASWIYDGVRVQKSNNSRWMDFLVELDGDKLTLSKNEAVYDYWSSKNSY